MSASLEKHRPLLVGVGLYLLLLLTACSFWPALQGPFVFDDFLNLQHLGQIDGHFSRESIGRYLYQFSGNPGRPLAALSFLIEDNAWPADPRDFKRNNLLLHLLLGLLVFAFARQMAGLGTAGRARAAAIALACSAMWLLQPMQLAATMLVVQRMNILASLFVLLGLVAHVHLIGSVRGSETRRVLAAILALYAAALVAILCKENGILVFAYALVVDLTLLRGRVLEYTVGSRRLLVGAAVAPLVLLAILALANPQSLVGSYAWRDFSLGERLLTQPRVLLDYLNLILLPRLGGNGLFHDGYLVSRSLWNPPSTLFALLAVLAAVIAAVRLRRRLPLLAFAVLWFVAGHLLESSVIALELYFSHRNYLPMIGPLFALACMLLQWAARGRHVAAWALVAWVGMAAWFTHTNAGIWGDRSRMAAVWLAESPASVRAVQMMASYYTDVGRTQEARQVLDEGYARLPHHTELRFQRVLLDCVDGGVAPGDWNALLELAASARQSRSTTGAVTVLAGQVVAGGCGNSLSPDDLRKLVSILLGNPQYRDYSRSASALYYALAQMAVAEGDLNAAIENLDRSYASSPNPLVAREAAVHLLSAGLRQPALEYLDRSERTPLPWLKRKLLGIEALNAPLRESAGGGQAPKTSTSADPGRRD